MSRRMRSRREFLRFGIVGTAALLIPRRMRADLAATSSHPTPRAGITGANVLTKDDLAAAQNLVPLFDGIREIPEIVDGIMCQCGCATLPGFYSLLSCYEKHGMARDCYICQGEGRLVLRLHKEGKSLDEIRVAIDAKFG